MATLIILAMLVFMQVVIPPAKLPDFVALLLGVLASVIVQFVKGRYQSRTVRFLISLLLSFVVGALSYFIAAPPGADLVTFVIHVFAYSQLAYNGFWKVIWEELLKLRKIGARGR